ncbi:hypothetical protein [Streptomyces sp. NPDC059262]|uniref:hypothetical protein n=1 Tax=Streptomyces sp. NPDC059262 TaxID=3346797 RepID=UPI0036A2D07A
MRTLNQLHTLLRDLLSGRAPGQMSADQATALLRTVRPAGEVEKAPRSPARELTAELRAIDKQFASNAARLKALMTASGATLSKTPGIGPVLAAPLIARVGRANRSPNAAPDTSRPNGVKWVTGMPV